MGIYDKKVEVMEKYKNVLGQIGELNAKDGGTPYDIGVAFDMLRHNLKLVEAGKDPEYKMPEEWTMEDYKAFSEDCKEL